ncbi:MAG: HAMP domain-containing protein [Phycisphaerae bacterium]|nr:HAMP domain-containing protein [Gemmatimonadaceae bacterium]
MRLTSRLLLSVLPLVALMMAGFGAWLLVERERSLVPEMQRQTRVYAHAVDIAFEYALRDLEPARLEEFIDRLSADSRIFGVLLYGADGALRYASDSLTGAAAAPDSMLSRVLRGGEELTFERVIGNRKVYAVLRSIREPPSDTARGRIPAGAPGAVLGALEIAQPFELLQGEQQRVRAEVVLVTLALMAALSLMLVFVTHRLVERPLQRLAAAARDLGQGNVEAHVLTSLGAAELNALAIEFNEMVERLGTARRALLLESETRVRLERRLAEAEKLATVGTVAAGLAHEIGAPLNVISGRAEMMLQQHGQDARISRHLESIIGQIGRITRTVRSLLDYARRPERRDEAVSFAAVIDGTVDLLEAEFVKGSVSVIRQQTSDVWVQGDADQLQQVMVNLILNALQAMDSQVEPRILTITLEEGEVDPALGTADAVIKIGDSGPGLADEISGRLFTPFSTTKKTGTGLGLVVARSMIQDHGGTLTGTNRIEGERGAVFTVLLPMSPGAVSA